MKNSMTHKLTTGRSGTLARPRFVAYGVFLLAISFSLQTLPAAVINVDVQGDGSGGSFTNYSGASANGPIASGTTWNHFDAGNNPPSASLGSLLDDSGAATTVQVELVSGWAGSFGDNSPNNLQGDRAFTSNVGTGTFTISGLNPGGVYNVAPITGAAGLSTDFTIGTTMNADGTAPVGAANGPITYTLGQTHALFSAVVANGHGEISFATQASASSNGVLAGLQIEGAFDGITPSPATYDQIINVDFDSTIPTNNYSGAGAVVDPGTFWNSMNNSGIVTDATASDGSTATPIDVTVAGNSGIDVGAEANFLVRDRLFTNLSVTATWSLDDLEVGREYDLLFYGVQDATYIANAGILEGLVISSISNGAVQANASPLHTDWIEDTHYTVLRFTASATTVSGTYTQPDGEATFNGIQLARVSPAVIPEPGTLTLLSTGLLGLLFCGRRRKR